MEDSPTFQCTGRVNINDHHLPPTSPLIRGDLDSLFSPSPPILPAVTTLFSMIQPTSTAILHLKHFIKLMEMHLRVLSRFESPQSQPTDCYQLRTEIITFIIFIKHYFQAIRDEWPFLHNSLQTELKTGLDEILSSIRRFFPRLKRTPPTSSNIGNRCTQPEFHLFHLHLELRWQLITLVHHETLPWLEIHDQNERLDRSLSIVIQDLVFLSLKIYERSSHLNQLSPYPCSCVRDLWIILQIVIERSEKLKSNFWDYVNGVINEMMKASMKNPEIFSLWMIYHLALLQGYHQDGAYLGPASARVCANSPQIEKLLKSFLDKGGKVGERDEIDEELRAMIPLLKTLVLEYWRSREFSINTISSLWECFHRRLEQPFLVQASGPWAISIEKKEPKDIIKQVKERIFDAIDNRKESSFGMFLRLLGIVLKNSYDKNDVKVWNQIRGRIYSKFSKSKVQEFSEVRLYNLISLLFTLGVTADAANVCGIVMDLLPNPLEIDCESYRRGVLSWKGQLCCLLVLAEKGLGFEAISAKLTSIVDALSCRRDEAGRSMMASFIQTLSIVLSSSPDLQRGEHHLIGGWIDRYLLECPKNRAGTMLKLLFSLLEKSKAIDISCSTGKPMLEALWASAAGRIRALVYDNDLTDDNCEDIARIGALFTLEALRSPKTAEAQKHSALSLFRHFTNTIYVKDIKISKLYLSIILENRSAVDDIKRRLETFDQLVIQVWIKCSIFNQDSGTGDMKIIKAYVLNLQEVEKVFPSWKDSLEFKSSKESLILYVNALAARRSSVPEAEKMLLDKRTRTLFSTLDKWVLNPIKEDNKDSTLSLSIYKSLGTIFLTCSPMLHTNSPSSMLRILITKVMLPSDDNGYLRHLGKKIFSMVMLGLESLKFDGVVDKIMGELMNVYLPLLIVEDNRQLRVGEQIIKFFKESKDVFCGIVLDKLAKNFVIIVANEMHKLSYLVMEVLKSLMVEDRRFFRFIVDKCFSNVLECYLRVHDLHPHRRQTIELIATFADSYRHDEELKTVMMRVFSNKITVKIRDYPKACFELLREISRIDKSVALNMMKSLEILVNELEMNRRPNAGSLRYSLRQLQEFCDNLS